MPRRRPTQVRQRRRLPGTSPSTLRALSEFERVRLWPGAIGEALNGWTRFVRGPLAALDAYEPAVCLDQACQWKDPAVLRETLGTALHALPTRASRELRALIQPLDETYLTRSTPVPNAIRLRESITGTPTKATSNELTITMDLQGAGWLVVELDDGRGAQRWHASFLTMALDDLLAALRSLTQGAPRAHVSWDGEPTEYRWLCTVDRDNYARVRILVLRDRSANLPDHDGHLVVDTDLPLQTLVKAVTTAARSLLARVGETEYARRWEIGPFPTPQLLSLEQWLAEQ